MTRKLTIKMIQDSAKTTCDSMATPNDTEEERRVGGGKGFVLFSCAAAIMDLSYPFPLVSKEPFFGGKFKYKKVE